MLTINKTFVSLHTNCNKDSEIANICQFFMDSPYIEDYIKNHYNDIIEEMENYIIMLIERSRGKENILYYDKILINQIHKSITNISPLIHKKIEESKMEEFGKFSLGEKYCLVKKIFELVDNSKQCKHKIFEDLKKRYFLWLFHAHNFSELNIFNSNSPNQQTNS